LVKKCVTNNIAMNRLFLHLTSMLFCGLVACSGTGRPNEMVKAVAKTDCCKLDPKNSYEVYIPERDTPAEKLPLLVIIDPHGSGKFALDKFKQGASLYPAVLIASNLVKNGFAGYESAVQDLIEDVRQKYPVGEAIFMTGFSGGARMALGYALSHHLNGLILCGALANADQINILHCPVFSISGMDDFNFMETAQYLFREQSTPANLKIELTNATHNWPDSPMLANAFGFLRLSCQATDIPSLPKSQLNTYCKEQHSRIDSLLQHGDFLKASLIAHNMASAEPFNSDKTFAATFNTLKTNPQYISQLNRLEKGLKFEISVRQSYLDAFRTKDTLWWKNEIRTTEEKIKTERDSYMRDTYRRIKGFWGIASYMFCKQAVKEQNTEALNKVLSIYRMLEPENPDMFYFSSFPDFWKGNNEVTLSLLRKALEAGFSDRGQLKKDFPESITSKLLND
jgi:predicted esterase